MKVAYFIGGSQDLSKRAIGDHPEMYMWFAKPADMPWNCFEKNPADIPSFSPIIRERYRLNYVSERTRPEPIAIYIFDGNE